MMDSPESTLTSFKYANDKPYVVSKKAIEKSSKVLKDLDEPVDEPPIKARKLEENSKDNQENVSQNKADDDDIEWSEGEDEDEIQWSGDEAELSREISILEQSISSKREHSPTKSPRKKKPY